MFVLRLLEGQAFVIDFFFLFTQTTRNIVQMTSVFVTQFGLLCHNNNNMLIFTSWLPWDAQDLIYSTDIPLQYIEEVTFSGHWIDENYY